MSSSTTSYQATNTTLPFVQPSTLSSTNNEVYEGVYVATGCLYVLMGLVVLFTRRRTVLSWPFVFFACLNALYYLAIGVADLANSSGVSSEWPLYFPPIAAMACFGGIVATFFLWTSNVHQVQTLSRPASWSGLTSGLLLFIGLLFTTVQLFAINKIITMDTSQNAGNPTLLLTISGYGMDGLSLLYLLLVIVSGMSKMYRSCTKKSHLAIIILIPFLFFISRAYNRIISALNLSFGFLPMVFAGFAVASLPDLIVLALIAIYDISRFGRDVQVSEKVVVGDFEMISPPIVINHPKYAATRNSVVQSSDDKATAEDPQFDSTQPNFNTGLSPRPTRPRPAARRTDQSLPVNSEESLNSSSTPSSRSQSPPASPTSPRTPSSPRSSPNSQQASTMPTPRPRPQSASPGPRPQSFSPGSRSQSASSSPRPKSTMEPYGHGAYPIQQQQQQLYSQRQQQDSNGQLHPPSPSYAAQGYSSSPRRYSASPGPGYRGSYGSAGSFSKSSQSTN